ncbi:hypothetical protein PO002_43470 [Cupriavidus necator]|uniref:hypothetical protein n=1 Tax=Cupriavidus necator TaxID=106590 RepID=UPI0039C3C94D
MESGLWIFRALCIGFTAYMAHKRGRNPWIWGALAYILLFATPFILAYVARREKRSLQQYLAQYPDARSKRGMSCAYCQSNSIRLWHQRGILFMRAKHLCNHCGSYLYDS